MAVCAIYRPKCLHAFNGIASASKRNCTVHYVPHGASVHALVQYLFFQSPFCPRYSAQGHMEVPHVAQSRSFATVGPSRGNLLPQSLMVRGVQYVHCVMQKCIMVKVWGKRKTYKVCKKTCNFN